MFKLKPNLVCHGDRIVLENKISTYSVNTRMVATAGFLKT